MEDIQDLVKKLAFATIDHEANSEQWVNITHVIDPLNFYVRPTKYNVLVNILESIKPTVKASVINLQDTVIFNMNTSSEVPKYARGRIILINSNSNSTKYVIFALDYGFIMNEVIPENVWECDKILLNIPALAYNCELANCAPLNNSKWTDETIDAFKYYIGNERAKMIIVDKSYDKLKIELINTNPDDIATLLALTGFSTLGYVDNTISRMPTTDVKQMYYTFKNLNIDETLHVRVQSGKTLREFFVAEVNDYNKYLKEMNDITYYAKKEKNISPEDFKKGTLVCVKDDLGKYDRGIIREVKNLSKTAIVHLVDRGKNEEVNILNMRYMPERCLTSLVICIYCSVSDDKHVWDNNLYRLLHPGNEFLITIQQIGDQLEIPSIVNISELKKGLGQKKREKRV